MIKILKICIIICLFLATNLNYAQEKVEDKANSLLVEMKEKLKSASAEELTADQEKQLLQLYTDKVKEIKKIRKEITDEAEQKEKIKEINKATAKKVNDEVLTKNQKTALRELKNKQ